ncbi:MAG: hypothetical protein HY644_03510 [Acidobacteria bacterium]|nr:hypothetical protein [Acidobacteriota bacterium]
MGWNIKKLEEFTTDTGDLVANYADWDNWITDEDIVVLETIAVDDGRAELRLADPTPKTYSVAGAKSADDSFVPDANFTSSASEKDKWTAVMDFYPVSSLSSGAHAGIFIRVLDRAERNEQTRFGCIIYTDGTGRLQFEGDWTQDSSVQRGNISTSYWSY